MSIFFRELTNDLGNIGNNTIRDAQNIFNNCVNDRQKATMALGLCTTCAGFVLSIVGASYKKRYDWSDDLSWGGFALVGFGLLVIAGAVICLRRPNDVAERDEENPAPPNYNLQNQ